MAEHPPTSEHRVTSWYREGSSKVRLLVGALAVVLAVIFTVQNRSRVRIHFIFFTVSSRLWVGFLVSLVLGALLGQAFGAYRKRARHSE